MADDDMYGSSLSAGRLSKLRGIQLKREAELLICISMIRRSEIHRPCTWREIFDDNDNNNDSISINTLNQLWKESFTSSLSDETLGALCIRVGPISKMYKWYKLFLLLLLLSLLIIINIGMILKDL